MNAQAIDSLLKTTYFNTIADTEKFKKSNGIRINKSKTKAFKSSKSRNWDFPPELSFSDGSPQGCKNHGTVVPVVLRKVSKLLED